MAGRLVLVSILALTATVGIAASGPWTTHVPAKDHARVSPFIGNQQAVSAGTHLYANHCQQCHRADGRGDGRKKPSLLTPEVQTATDGDLEWFLRQGDLAHGMPSWSNLPEAQRWQIIAYLRTLK